MLTHRRRRPATARPLSAVALTRLLLLDGCPTRPSHPATAAADLVELATELVAAQRVLSAATALCRQGGLKYKEEWLTIDSLKRAHRHSAFGVLVVHDNSSVCCSCLFYQEKATDDARRRQAVAGGDRLPPYHTRTSRARGWPRWQSAASRG
jgi:hypothetical protein